MAVARKVFRDDQSGDSLFYVCCSGGRAKQLQLVTDTIV